MESCSPIWTCCKPQAVRLEWLRFMVQTMNLPSQPVGLRHWRVTYKAIAMPRVADPIVIRFWGIVFCRITARQVVASANALSSRDAFEMVCCGGRLCGRCDH